MEIILIICDLNQVNKNEKNLLTLAWAIKSEPHCPSGMDLSLIDDGLKKSAYFKPF